MIDKSGFVDKGNIVHFGQTLHLLIANAQHQQQEIFLVDIQTAAHFAVFLNEGPEFT